MLRDAGLHAFATVLGRLGGLKGGPARAKKLSKKNVESKLQERQRLHDGEKSEEEKKTTRSNRIGVAMPSMRRWKRPVDADLPVYSTNLSASS